MPSEALAGWRDSLAIYLHPRPLTMLFLGFSSGLPRLLVFGSLSFWLREAGIDRSTIGFVSWVALAYGFKWVWAPLVDRARLPLIGAVFGDSDRWAVPRGTVEESSDPLLTHVGGQLDRQEQRRALMAPENPFPRWRRPSPRSSPPTATCAPTPTTGCANATIPR